jgi:hypothetical protein
MKSYLTYAVAILVATMTLATAAPDKDALMEKENAAWQAFKDKKADDFKKVVSADILGVYDNGMADMAKELSDMQKWDMKSFAISDFKITSVGKNIIMSSYVVKIEGTVAGKDASGTYNAGSVWKKEKGEWQAIFHTNVKQEAAAK